MTLTDQQVIDIINDLLDRDGQDRGTHVQQLIARRGIAALRSLGPLVDRYLAIMNPPQLCQIEHDHWEGKMICGNPLPCRTHGDR